MTLIVHLQAQVPATQALLAKVTPQVYSEPTAWRWISPTPPCLA
ncbi:hypothetical protein [Pseudomonas mangrovi]|jgi:hypothetical protein|nr:hypothetical protein [Pseudomonas mangrovi]